MKTYQMFLLAVISGLITTPAWGKHNSEHPLTDEDWVIVQKNIALMDSVTFIPTLLPVIMLNKDVLQLTAKQLNAFRDWRKEHYVPMVNLMNRIIEARIAFKQTALDPNISPEELQDMQNHIFEMQSKLMKIRSSCRQLVMESFTEEQWDNFGFIIPDYPELAAFFQ
jgi:hypothetical protein